MSAGIKIDLKNLQNAFEHFSTPDKSFNTTQLLLDISINSTEIKKEPDLIEQTGQMLAIFSKTQNVCSNYLKKLYTGDEKLKSKIEIKQFKTIGQEIPENKDLFSDLENKYNGKNDSEVRIEINYGIEDLLDKDEVKFEDLFRQLKYNTNFFFFFVDEYFGSINQYFKYVNPKLIPGNNSLIDMKNFFSSFDNLREPAQHLIRLFNNKYFELIKKEEQEKDKKEDKKDTVNKIESKKNRFQLQNLSRCIYLINVSTILE